MHIRLTEREREEIKQIAEERKIGFSDVIRLGINYIKMVDDITESIKGVNELMIPLLQEALNEHTAEFMRRAKEKLATPEFQEKLSKIAPELKNKTKEFARTLEKLKPYKRHRGPPPTHN